MEIKIFVVQNPNGFFDFEKEILENCQTQILNDFEGLTIFKNGLGLWKNPETQKTETDKTDLWLIAVNCEDKQHKKWIRNRVYGLALKIKETTNQKTQMYMINGKKFLI